MWSAFYTNLCEYVTDVWHTCICLENISEPEIVLGLTLLNLLIRPLYVPRLLKMKNKVLHVYLFSYMYIHGYQSMDEPITPCLRNWLYDKYPKYRTNTNTSRTICEQLQCVHVCYAYDLGHMKLWIKVYSLMHYSSLTH